MIARFATLLAVLCLAAPAAAVAQDNPFAPIPQPAPQQPTVTGDPNADPLADEDDGLGETQQLLIGLAGFVLLVGIGWLIVRDARTRAPVERRDALMEDGERRKGSQPPKRKQVARQRAAAKRARQQRKKNR